VLKYFDNKGVFLIKVKKLTKITKNYEGSNQAINIQAIFLPFSDIIDHVYKPD